MLKNIVITFLAIIAAFLLFIAVRDSQDKPPKGTEDQILSDTPSTPAVQENTGRTNTDSNNSIDLSGQGLEKLPSYVFDNTSVEVLDISSNNLTGALPGEIRLLSNLKVLNASNNKMTGVPAEIGQLDKLEVLDLSNNQLTGLPNEMGNLKNLKQLDLSGNNYSVQDLENIKQRLSSDVKIIL